SAPSTSVAWSLAALPTLVEGVLLFVDLVPAVRLARVFLVFVTRALLLLERLLARGDLGARHGHRPRRRRGRERAHDRGSKVRRRRPRRGGQGAWDCARGDRSGDLPSKRPRLGRRST